ncbi:hypothetical protein KA013_01085 [Patescibacteria group bacterium]|nr:hypothetical protein [Patescibacteria group bacterium]
MKKLFSLLVLPVLAFTSLVGVTNAQFIKPNPYEDPSNAGEVEQVNVPGQGSGQQDSFVNVVRGAINWILGILAFIALIILLYGGFLMVTAAGEEDKYKKGFTILKQAAVGLILIGVAWFILSLVFWLVNLTTGQAGGTAGTAG